MNIKNNIIMKKNIMKIKKIKNKNMNLLKINKNEIKLNLIVIRNI